MNANLEFRREVAKEQGITLMQASCAIADRARKVAELARCEFGGLDKRGCLFYLSFSQLPNQIYAPTELFSYETVYDEPSRVIQWTREQTERAGLLGYR